ncbi:hypothetical protein [Streptococcus ovis]
MIATIVLTVLIATGVLFGLRNFIKGKGSCGDCNCSCPIKEEMHKVSKVD